MAVDREARENSGRDQGKPPAPSREREPAEAGAESYGGDVDTGPSVTEEEIEDGLDRDQAEG